MKKFQATFLLLTLTVAPIANAGSASCQVSEEGALGYFTYEVPLITQDGKLFSTDGVQKTKNFANGYWDAIVGEGAIVWSYVRYVYRAKIAGETLAPLATAVSESKSVRLSTDVRAYEKVNPENGRSRISIDCQVHD